MDSRGDPRKLWRTVSALMGDSEQKGSNETTHNAEDFAQFFLQKINSIRSETEKADAPVIPDRPVEHLEEFATVTAEEVETLIMKAPNKTCSSDPMPTWLVKKFNLLAPFIALLFNVSLSPPGSFQTVSSTP